MMRKQTRQFPLAKLLTTTVFALGAGLAGSQAMAADMSPQQAQDQYKLDVERCRSGQTAQDEATCMREAGAALQEARRNRLVRGTTSFDENQRARCDRLSGTEREDCMSLMSDPSPETQGSVAGGGILRQTTITVPGETVQPGAYAPAPTDSVSPAAPAYGDPAMAPAPTPSTGTHGNMGTGTTSPYGPGTTGTSNTMPSNTTPSSTMPSSGTTPAMPSSPAPTMPNTATGAGTTTGVGTPVAPQ